MKKLLSICIPTFNREQKLIPLLKHILRMDPKLLDQIEIIVSDNHSTDGTSKFFLDISHESINYLKYFRNSSNIGAAKNLKHVFDLAKTPYVWWMGDDDWFDEANLEGVLSKIQIFSPDLLLLNRRIFFSDSSREVRDIFKYFFQANTLDNLDNILKKIGPLSLLGLISGIVLKKINYEKENYDWFVNFQTSYAHVGYLVANYFDKKCYLDVENKITHYSFSNFAEYDHIFFKDSKYKQFSQVLGINLPKMYLFLLNKGYLQKNHLYKSKEIRYSNPILHINTLIWLLFFVVQVDFKDQDADVKYFIKVTCWKSFWVIKSIFWIYFIFKAIKYFVNKWLLRVLKKFFLIRNLKVKRTKRSASFFSISELFLVAKKVFGHRFCEDLECFFFRISLSPYFYKKDSFKSRFKGIFLIIANYKCYQKAYHYYFNMRRDFKLNTDQKRWIDLFQQLKD